MDAFDADVLIYAAVPGHPVGRRVAALFDATAAGVLAGAGSVLLLPEVLGKPLRHGAAEEVQILAGLLACWPGSTCVRSIARRRSWPLRCAAGTGCAGSTRPTWRRPSA